VASALRGKRRIGACWLRGTEDRSTLRSASFRSLMPNRQYEQLSTSDEPLDDDGHSPRPRSTTNTPLAKYLLLALTFVVVTFCSYKAGQWSVQDPQRAGGGDISAGIPNPKPDNSSTDTPTMPGNGKYSVG
jgi:hypothetical protein